MAECFGWQLVGRIYPLVFVCWLCVKVYSQLLVFSAEYCVEDHVLFIEDLATKFDLMLSSKDFAAPTAKLCHKCVSISSINRS